MEQDTAFADWITETTTGKVAELLDTSPANVRKWRLGWGLPNIPQMYKIKKITRGRISYEQILEGSCAKTFIEAGGK